MGERRGTKALELWCRRITDGYPGVSVQNMTTSWKDGLAFCAMIHHFRPDLIDFKSLDKNDVYANNELAFRTAQEHLGIPALLDAEDMASCSVPDRLSILTYLSQFYQVFGGSSPSRLAMTRTTETTDGRIAPVAESPQPKVESRLGMRRDHCAACGLPVFLAEKLVVSRTPYHRTCFRCARCSGQLMPGNYYETEEGQYCCETCPDEENTKVPLNFDEEEPREPQEDVPAARQRSLSDEEKTEQKMLSSRTNYRHLDDPMAPDLITQTAQMRLDFISGHLRSERTSGTSNSAFDPIKMIEGNVDPSNPLRGRIVGARSPAFPDGDDDDIEEEEEDEESKQKEDSMSNSCSTSVSSFVETELKEDTKSESRGENREELGGIGHVVHNAVDIKLEDRNDKRLTATSALTVDKDINVVDNVDNTKDPPGQVDESDKSVSLVQKRLKIFETQGKKENIEKAEDFAGKSALVQAFMEPREKSVKPLDDLKVAQPKLSPEVEAEAEAEAEGEAKSEDLKLAEKEEDAKVAVPPVRIRGKKVNPKTSTSTIDRSNTESSSPGQDLTSDSFMSTTSMEDSKERERGPCNVSLLKAKGIDLSIEREYPEELNPFKSDDEEDDAIDDYKTALTSGTSRLSTNPFGSDDDEIAEEEQASTISSPPRPAVRSSVGKKTPEMTTKRKLVAPQISLNPFWSEDEEEHESDTETKIKASNLPIPKPRTMRQTPELDPMYRKSDLARGDMYASNSSIASSESLITTPGGTYRKKKPAPQPPSIAKDLFSPHQLHDASPGHRSISPRTTGKTRKTKPAPPPPMPTSTPQHVSTTPIILQESPISELHDTRTGHKLNMWEDQKINKDEANRSKQGISFSSEDDKSYKSYTDKSIHGKWKRKKGPAPPRPIPHRRKIKVMSLKDVKLELDEIEVQQQGLERQGVRLEQLIRDRTESGSEGSETSVGADVEELILELFTLVNEKNELFRRQAELMLLRRQQRLEEEHVEVEYQIRCLMCQPEATKTDFDKQREEALIQRLVEIVERRNEIVECLEMDRRREVEEDRSIHKQMGLFAAKNKGEILRNDNESSSLMKKKGKIREKLIEKKLLKKNVKKDIDKDVDETELKVKRHSKRKWF